MNGRVAEIQRTLYGRLGKGHDLTTPVTLLCVVLPKYYVGRKRGVVEAR